MHDIRFILPITLKGKYFQRMQDMKRYGFLNIKNILAVFVLR